MPRCCCTTPAQIKQVYRYNAGADSGVVDPPTFTPNDNGIVPDDPMQPATCYPATTDGSGPVYNWDIENGLWV